MENYMIQKNGKLYDPKNENLYGYNHWILHGGARAGSGSDREAIGEGPIHTTVGRKLCFRRAPVVNLGFYGKPKG